MSVTPANNGAAAGTAPPPPPPDATTKISNKNLLQQLPSGAVLAFQALAASFTNQGNCLKSNYWLTVGLVTVLSASCIFSSFTDSLIYDGRVYYGVATPGRLNIINLSKEEEKEVFRDLRPELKRRGLKPVDWVHASLSLVVFLTIAGSDVGLQKCFFPRADDDARQLMRNLPLGMAVMASFLFMIFPTTRKGITLDKAEPPAPAEEEDDSGSGNKGGGQTQKQQPAAADRVFTSSANLLQLLPTGPVLAFQTLAASFTNQGNCYNSNLSLTAGLVTFLTATCIFSAFTDCVPDRSGKVRKGVALPGRLHIIGLSRKEQSVLFESRVLRQRRLKRLDWIHAFFSAVVFLTIAGSDVGLQNCFFPKADDNDRQLLKNLPLGVAVLSSFVFIIFPTTRKSVCFDDSEYSVIEAGDPEKQQTATPSPVERARN
jgi:hypothetical protein